MTPRDLAVAVHAALRPACHKTVVAGSLRRECLSVGDVDIVAWPIRDHDLLEEESKEYSALDAALSALVGAGTLAFDRLEPRDGPRYKRFVAPTVGNLPVEIWIGDKDNFGYLLALRTGPAELNRRLVLPVRQGGLCPGDVAMIGGHLYWYASAWSAAAARKAQLVRDGVRLSCPSEAAFFEHMGLPCPEPARRDDPACLAEMMSIAGRGGLRRRVSVESES
jgi:hypothetical protein